MNPCVSTKALLSLGSGAIASASIVSETEADTAAELAAVPRPNPISTSSVDLLPAQNLNTVRM